MKKASDLFVQSLENEGVRRIFGVPGEENLDLIESLRRSSIEFVVTRHEQAAGFMAATSGRLDGKPGVCLSTLGPGATNLTTAVAYAQLGGMPLVVITGQKPIRNPKQGRFQILDVVDFMTPITKYSRQIESGDLIPSEVREAFRIAIEERPGVAHLELPEDIAREESDQLPIKSTVGNIAVANQPSVEAAADRIAAAESPLIMIGAAANRHATCASLHKLLKTHCIPFFTTQMGKGVLDETDPNYLGTAALSEGDLLHQAIAKADLIINVGHTVIEKPPFEMTADGPTVLHINFNQAHADPVYFPQYEVIGDIATSIDAIRHCLSRMKPRPTWDFEQFQSIAKAYRNSVHLGEDDDRFPMNPQRVVRDIQKSITKATILTLDNGLYKIWFARNFMANRSDSLLLDNALGTMGAGLPSAIAAKLAYPERPVVAACGDGGFFMNGQELATAIALQLDLIVLVLRDDAYGMIRWKQKDMGFSNYAMDFHNPDILGYARSFGAHASGVESPEQLSERLAQANAQGGLHVIDVPIDYSDTDKLLEHCASHSCTEERDLAHA